MPKTLSRWLLAIELVFIAGPVSVLLLLFACMDAPAQAWRYPDLHHFAVLGLALVALAGLTAGWVLGLSFVARGNDGLRSRHGAWWALASAGGMLALAALASNLAPPSADYSELWWFRQDFGMFALGLLLLLPFLHLGIERLRGGGRIDAGLRT
jgi:hypothetical protein